MKPLFWLNAALLAAHQVGASQWREWELRHLPGGATGLAVVHVIAFLILLWGHGAVLLERRTAIAWSFGLATAGLAVAGAHGLLLLQEGAVPRIWPTGGLLGAIVLVSALQILTARFEQRVHVRASGRGGDSRVFLEIS